MRPSEIERLKELLPTSLGSAEIREQIAADILRRSVFSARMESAHYLAKIREVCAEISEGTINQAEARTRLLRVLTSLGHDAAGANPNDLKDPVSERRLNLIIDTQRQMAASVSRLMQQDEGTLEQFPGWELCRMGSRAMPRQDWLARWNAAGESVGWEGAHRRPIYGDATAWGFLALKTSPIWAALGNGVGGFSDTLGNPYPPFAYSSGMAWMDADRETCEQYGLKIGGEGAAETREIGSPGLGGKGAAETREIGSPGLGGVLAADITLSPSEKDILDAVDRYGFDISEGLL